MESKTVYVEHEASYIETCPICGKKALEVREAVHLQPYLGRTLIVSRLCKNCGYKRAEMVPLNPKKRKIVVFKVSSEEDLYARIVRTGTATIYIPELEAVIDPGVDAPFFVTNVEGLLGRIEDAVERIKVLEGGGETVSRVEELKRLIERFKRGEGELTIVIDDPIGLSDVIASAGKVIREHVGGS